jgi:glycosyltransferase involved in cell wall biosynthesis
VTQMPAPPTIPKVSAVVPTYQRAERLPRLVDAILADEGVSEAVIVVDGSTDGSIEYLRERAATDGRLVPVLTPNSGDAAARRTGIERASGEVILMLDDDVVPEPGLAAGHARHHAQRRGLVVVGYMPVAPWPGPGPEPFTADLYSRDYERACLEYERDPDSILTGLWAGNVSLRREDCLRVGLSSPEFGRGYHADRDFGLRCRAAGLTGVFDRSLRAEHRYERDTAAFLRDAYSSGHTRSLAHRVHADVTGPLRPDFYEAGLPGPSRLLVRLARRPPGRRLARGLLFAVLAGAGRCRLATVERHAGYVLGAIEGQRGAMDAARGRPGVGR